MLYEKMNTLRRCVFGLLMLAVCVGPGSSLANEEPPMDCRLRQAASIDLKIGSSVLIPAAINGTPAYMTLNSALPVSAISKQAADEMKRPTRRAPVLNDRTN
jgi:hypothetical protein